MFPLGWPPAPSKTTTTGPPDQGGRATADEVVGAERMRGTKRGRSGGLPPHLTNVELMAADWTSMVGSP